MSLGSIRPLTNEYRDYFLGEGGKVRSVPKADNLINFMCRLSGNLGDSVFCSGAPIISKKCSAILILFSNSLITFFFFFFFLGPGRMPQMHRSHIGLLCYPRIVKVFFDVPTFVTGPSSSSVLPERPPSSERWNCVGNNHGR